MALKLIFLLIVVSLLDGRGVAHRSDAHICVDSVVSIPLIVQDIADMKYWEYDNRACIDIDTVDVTVKGVALGVCNVTFFKPDSIIYLRIVVEACR